MKHVTIIVPEGYANLSSIAGAFQIFNRANGYWQKKGNKPMMNVRIAGFVQELKLDAGFFSIHPVNISDIPKTDLLIIPSVSHEYDRVIMSNALLIDWIRGQYKSGAEIASICTGAFLLAATGLLEGKCCSTHWNAAEDFRRLFPNVNLQVDKLLTVEPGIYTNGGAYSFLNLMLFLVEKYFDRDTAIFCSKVFQIDIERASQSPFFIFQAQKNHGDDIVCKAQNYIEENLSEKISFGDLASKLAISRRNFDRRFFKAVGNTPVEYLQRVKVEVAKKTLEKGKKSVFEVMNDVGYSDDKAFREVFRKITGLSPLDYKARFNRESVLAVFDFHEKPLEVNFIPNKFQSD
ncbi:GlxA family transcriptional regulator [Dyadobacter subterraneus]|uniref:Helix-turn-helix domain-containing protein n=1 Tax=Dyadobacter subterraneus TaxID=2773304 RepID=A0ABR9W840_9BACT|nr:helix-turn-helix domain-containing protein [Dyadobacter subterraneus]MBE9461624.1 helix-turn-helix domain-containing protein [Dyadobacter subterraneus]